MDPKMIDDITRRIQDAMPGGFNVLQHDVEKNMRSVLQSVFAKMDLVTREQFDVQAGVLARTREKVESLERQVALLEALVLKKDQS